MKIGKLIKAVLKLITVAIVIGTAVYVIKDILDTRNSDNFDDVWEDDFDDNQDVHDQTSEEVPREYIKVDPVKTASESCEN